MADAAWDIIYYRTADGRVPAEDFLEGCPAAIEARFMRILDDVALGPPLSYRGGGYWEAMHDPMTGWHEVRLTGPGREQFRLFCLLEDGPPDELERRGLARPAIAVIDGRRKTWMTKFDEADYGAVRVLGENHRGQFPRRIAQPDPEDRTVVAVTTTRHEVMIETASGERRSIPLFGRLAGAGSAAREMVVLSGDGRTIHWPILDEHCSVDQFFPSD